MKKLISVILIVALVFPAIAVSEDVKDLLCGKWSFYWDITKMPAAVQKVLDNSLVSYELYFFDNNAVYMTEMHRLKNSDVPTFSYGALSGLWMGEADDLTVMIKDKVYKAEINENGNLLFYMTSKIAFHFVRVDSNAYMESEIK